MPGGGEGEFMIKEGEYRWSMALVVGSRGGATGQFPRAARLNSRAVSSDAASEPVNVSSTLTSRQL